MATVSAAFDPGNDGRASWHTNVERLWGDPVVARIDEVWSEPIESAPQAAAAFREVSSILRTAEPELWSRSCVLAYRTFGSLTAQEEDWCGFYSLAVEAVAERDGLAFDDNRVPGDFVEACKRAYAERGRWENGDQ